MSLDYLISPEARDDIDRTYAWYEAQAPGRGDAFLTEVADMVARLRVNPALYGLLDGRTRAAPLPNSKYIVYYRIEPNRVRVVAVQHATADPRKWRRRR